MVACTVRKPHLPPISCDHRLIETVYCLSYLCCELRPGNEAKGAGHGSLVVGEEERLIGPTMVVPSCSGEVTVVAGGEAVTTEVLKMGGRIPVLVGSAVLIVCGGSVATVRE